MYCGTVTLCLELNNLGGQRLHIFCDSGLGEKIRTNSEHYMEKRREKGEVVRGKKGPNKILGVVSALPELGKPRQQFTVILSSFAKFLILIWRVPSKY